MFVTLKLGLQDVNVVNVGNGNERNEDGADRSEFVIGPSCREIISVDICKLGTPLLLPLSLSEGLPTCATTVPPKPKPPKLYSPSHTAFILLNSNDILGLGLSSRLLST